MTERALSTSAYAGDWQLKQPYDTWVLFEI